MNYETMSSVKNGGKGNTGDLGERIGVGEVN